MALFDKPLINFEMANNHQGNVAHGLRIIREISDVAKDFKDDFDFAFKFQYRNLDTFIHPHAKGREDIKNVKRFQDTRLSVEDFNLLRKAVADAGLYPMCTPFDEDSAKRIADEGYSILKIASCSFTDWPLLEAVGAAAQTAGIPVIASAAGASLDEIDKVVSFFMHRGISFALMHCVAEYPTPDKHLEMNQIDLFRNRYPQIPIGFSTHEPPENMEPVLVAVAKGARILERHVGVETDAISLNAYSSTPGQVREWLNAARRAFSMCGVPGKRYEPLQKERDDLAALQRGVFAKEDLVPGKCLSPKDYYLAFPCRKGQLLARDLSKYISITTEDKHIHKDDAILLDDVSLTNTTGQIQNIVKKVVQMLKKSNVVIPKDSTCEISHHYGIDRFAETGLAMISVINREYCKKILVVLPGQSHPSHYHKKKEETFLVLYGTLDVLINGEERKVGVGDALTVERDVPHAFSSADGCVFEEISTTHYADDSYYEDSKSFVSPRKTVVYLTAEMLEDYDWQ